MCPLKLEVSLRAEACDNNYLDRFARKTVKGTIISRMPVFNL